MPSDPAHDRWRRPLALWAAVAVVLHVAQRAALHWWPGHVPHRALLPTSASQWAAPWLQYDAWDYVRIATGGYPEDGERTLAVWFPAYPVLIRALATTGLSADVAAVAVAALGGLVALVVVWNWLRARTDDVAVAATALALVALYPYGWFLYGGAYSSSVFLALAAGAFLAWERDRTVVAGLLAAAASTAHPTGVAVIAGLAVAELHRSRTAAAPIRWGVAWSVLGLAAYSAYLGVTQGRPLLWLTGRSDYEGSFLHDLSKVDFASRFVTGSDPRRLFTTTIQFVLVVAVLALLPRIWRRIGPGHATYVAVVVAIPVVLTADFNGCGRYLLAAFPAALAGAEVLVAHRRWQVGVLAAFAVGLVSLSLLYGRSWYLT